MPFLRPRRRKGRSAAKTDFDNAGAGFYRFAHPPPPVRQARKGQTTVTAAEVLSIPAFYAATRTVASLVSGLPVVHGDSLDPVSENSGFVADPTDDLTWRQLIFGTVVNLVVHGNSFWLIQDIDMMGRITKVYPVPPEQIRIQRRPRVGGGAGVLEYYTLGGVLGPFDLFHFKLFPVGGYDVSLSPLVALARHLALMISESESALNLYEDGGVPQGYWSTRETMDETYMKTLAGEISESSMGGRGRGTLIVDRGLEYKVPAMSFAEMQLLEARQWSAAEAAQIVGVPPHLVGAPTYDSETYSSVQQDLDLFGRINLSTYRDAITDTLNDMGMIIDLPDAEVTKLSPVDQATADKIDIESGVITVNDARANRGMPPVKGGDLRPWERKNVEGAPQRPTPGPESGAPSSNGNGQVPKVTAEVTP